MKPYFAALLILAIAQTAGGQPSRTKQNETKSAYWFNVGLGWGGQGKSFNLGMSYEISASRILSLNYSAVRTSRRCTDYLLALPLETHPLGEDANAYEITYGFLKKDQAGIMALSAGLSFVKIKSGKGDGPRRGGIDPVFGVGSDCPVNYEMTKANTIGLALRGEFMASARSVGFGICPYLNINPKYVFASLTFQLTIGRLKPIPKKSK